MESDTQNNQYSSKFIWEVQCNLKVQLGKALRQVKKLQITGLMSLPLHASLLRPRELHMKRLKAVNPGIIISKSESSPKHFPGEDMDYPTGLMIMHSVQAQTFSRDQEQRFLL